MSAFCLTTLMAKRKRGANTTQIFFLLDTIMAFSINRGEKRRKNLCNNLHVFATAYATPLHVPLVAAFPSF